MSRQLTYVIAVAVVISLATSPVTGNWFGKRGNKPDLFSILLQHQAQAGAVKRSDLEQLTGYTSPTKKLSAVAAIASIDSIVQAYKQQSGLGTKAIQH